MELTRRTFCEGIAAASAASVLPASAARVPTGTPRAVELFAGIGGFRLASDRLGLKTVWANDINEKAVAVYRDRFGSDVLVQGDIDALLADVPEHDVLTGGFPCQPFSRAGKKMGVDSLPTWFDRLSAERTQGLRLQVLDVKYLRGPEIADRHLCEVAEGLKQIFVHDEDMLRRAVHFLAYVNQGDWEAARLLDVLYHLALGESALAGEMTRIVEDFKRKNRLAERELAFAESRGLESHSDKAARRQNRHALRPSVAV